MTHYTKQDIQHMTLEALVHAKQSGKEVALIGWNFNHDRLSVIHTCEIKLSTSWKESWKILRNQFIAHGRAACVGTRATMFGKTWHALVIPYTEDSPVGQLFNTDPCSLMNFGRQLAPAVRVIWFSRKTNRDRYLKYMNK